MRLEYKFLLPIRFLQEFRTRLQPYTIPDKFTQQNPAQEYTVRSIYFDTARLRFYHEKLAGLRNRKKLRIRGYGQPNAESKIFLEIKRKYENYGIKDRASLFFRDLETFFGSFDIDKFILNDQPDACEGARRFIHHVIKSNLNPTVLVVYQREAYISKFDRNLRITFDKSLRYSAFPSLHDLFRDDHLVMAMNHYFILEIKFEHGYPIWLRRIVEDHNLTRQALSKYTICLDGAKELNLLRRRTTLQFTDRLMPARGQEEELVSV
jgi:hypothetical protein